jgi:large subunit ribosomal protein L3
MRTGVLVEKLGMTRVFDEIGNSIPVTVLLLAETIVVEKITEEKDGYNSVKIATSLRSSSKKVNKPQLKVQKRGKKLYNKVKEFRVSRECLLEEGVEISVSHFVAGQYVDVQGKSIGKGFAGAMKRHGFGGLEATHGVSVSHRSHGSTGQCQDPGRVFKGKKMAGHLGDATTTVQNLEVVEVDNEKSLILVRGAVPGKCGAIISLRDSLKKALPASAPRPTYVKKEGVKEEVNEQNIQDTQEAEKPKVDKE